MKLTFEKLVYKNIMSVGAKPVEIDLLSFKKTLITGKNGGGKSTMLEALCFALYNKPFRSIKKGQLLNTINKKGLLVELWFNDGKNSYHIKRGIKPNVFEIKRNGEEIPEAATVKDFQTMFETDIIKMNIQSFKQTIILGTAGYTPFMELTAGSRRTLIEDLINLSIYSKMDMLNKSVVKEIKQQMDALEIRITGVRNEYDAHMVHINKQKSMSDDFYNQLKGTHDSNVVKIKELHAEITQLTSKIGLLVIDTSYQESLEKCLKAIDMIDFKVNGIVDNEKFFASNESCPTCKQNISHEHKTSITNTLNTTKVGLLDKRVKVQEQIRRLLDEKGKASLVQSEINNLQSQVATARTQMSLLMSATKSLKSQMEAAQSSSEIDTTRVDELRSSMEEMRTEKTSLFEEMYARKIVLNMLKDSGIKSVVMKQYIPVINQKINHYLKILGADYTFTLDQEFNEIIKSRGREDFSYASFSQGEKARIDLSLLFTWRDVAAVVSGTEINLLILDEVFDSATDSEGVAAIQRILTDIKSNVVVISHREEHDKDSFDKHIRMIKKGRFSIME